MRVAAKQRSASNSADGPRKNLSPALDDAKLASALRAMPPINTQVPQRKMAAGTSGPQYPARPNTISAARTRTAADTALASRSVGVRVAPPHAAPLKAIPRASSTWYPATTRKPAAATAPAIRGSPGRRASGDGWVMSVSSVRNTAVAKVQLPWHQGSNSTASRFAARPDSGQPTSQRRLGGEYVPAVSQR
jgi:hypothetical protein